MSSRGRSSSGNNSPRGSGSFSPLPPDSDHHPTSTTTDDVDLSVRGATKKPCEPLSGCHCTVWRIAAVFVVFAAINAAVFVLLAAGAGDDDDGDIGNACDVFCHGPILSAIQLAGFFNDSKTFVDMPLRFDPVDVIDDFDRIINKTDRDELWEFLLRNFDEPGSDVIEWVPNDFNPSPQLLQRIADPNLRYWAKQVNDLWRVLGKSPVDDVSLHPQRHTLLPLSIPHMIVPGGRFREFYYWDSYWIVRGLMIAEMHTTAQSIVSNFLAFVDQYGFVPNGARRYYFTRSQPPFLSLMVDAVSNKTGLGLISRAFPTLCKEYDFWMRADFGHSVAIVDGDGVTHTLNRYFGSSDLPRPESFVEDTETAAHLTDPVAKAEIWNNLVAGAESGWDYSSRWFADSHNLTTIGTTDIVPVELNAILYKVEVLLSRFASMIGDTDKESFFKKASVRRQRAIHALLWSPADSRWADFNLTAHAQTERSLQSVSAFVPLWAQCFNASLVNVDEVVLALDESELLMPGGLATTLTHTGQQWDYPNAWAPLQHLIIEGLQQADSNFSRLLAFELAEIWITSNWIAFNRTEIMYEKYLATQLGATGGGGEYRPQAGFGWTNGVVLILLDEYGANLTVNTSLALTATGGPFDAEIELAESPSDSLRYSDRRTDRTAGSGRNRNRRNRGGGRP